MRTDKILLIFSILLVPFFLAVQSGRAGSAEEIGGIEYTINEYFGRDFRSISADGRFVVFQLWIACDLEDCDDVINPVLVEDRQTGRTTTVSVSSDGEGANVSSGGGFISADGRFVVFNSGADNLVPGDTNDTADIFVHDRQIGQTTRVNVNSDGDQANGGSGGGSISADGRFVVFNSGADNLVPGDTNDATDVFVHDRQTGQTTRVSVNSDGDQANDGSGGGFISADGRFVVFNTGADNIVAGDTNGCDDVFVHDRQTGQTTRVSVNSDGDQANDSSGGGSMSADGRFVVFESGADNLVPGDTNGCRDVFVHDRQTGQTTTVSVNSDGEQANWGGWGGSISADGRFVAFIAEAENFAPQDIGPYAYLHDRQTGNTTLASVFSDGSVADYSECTEISANGRFVAFCYPNWRMSVIDFSVYDKYGVGYADIIDNTDQQFTTTGYWSVSDAAPGFYGTDYAYAKSGDGSSAATFTFEIPVDGNYQISAQWPAHNTRAPDAPFTLTNNGKVVDTTWVDQRINGDQFNPLSGAAAGGMGFYTLNVGVLEVTLSNDAAGKVAADAVKIVRMPDNGVRDTNIVDNAGIDFSATGYWSVSDAAPGFYGTDYAYAKSGDGSSVATFTFEIPADGNFQISAQWPAHDTRAPDAPFTLINNGTVIDTILVDQRINGGQFNLLTGPVAIDWGVYALSAGVLEVALSNDASGKVAADAVKIVRMPDNGFMNKYIIDNADDGLDDDLVAYYPFNGNADDESGNGNNGTVFGAALTDDRAGNANSAFSFDGMDDYIEVPSFSELTFDEFTISMWVKIADGSYINNRKLFTIDRGSDPQAFYFGIQGNSGGALSVYIYGEEINEYDWAFENNQWTHIAVAYDGNTVALYKNGILTESGVIVGDIVSGRAYIGGDYSGTRRNIWDGEIDDIRVYDRALSENEIKMQFFTTGYWSVSDAAPGFYGTDYAYAKSGDGSSVATFTFEIPTEGNYEISAQWPAHNTRAPDVPFTLINNGTIIDTMLVDQRINGGQFNPLTGPVAMEKGVYALSAGVLEVTLSNDANGKVAADAVQVVRKWR